MELRTSAVAAAAAAGGLVVLVLLVVEEEEAWVRLVWTGGVSCSLTFRSSAGQ
jgi:hypothetical protein